MGDIHHDRLDSVLRKNEDKEISGTGIDGRPTTESPYGLPYSDDLLLAQLFRVHGEPRK